MFAGEGDKLFEIERVYSHLKSVHQPDLMQRKACKAASYCGMHSPLFLYTLLPQGEHQTCHDELWRQTAWLTA